MKTAPLFLLATAVLLCASQARSQGINSDRGDWTITATTLNREKPIGPLLKAPPDDANWSVVFAYPEDAAKKPESGQLALAPQLATRPRKMAVTKTGATMRVETTDVTGRITRKWYLGDAQYTLPPGQKLWRESKGSPESNDPDFEQQSAAGFSAFEWVSDQAYFGRISFGGRNCLVFVPGGAAVLDSIDASLEARKIQEILAAQPIVAFVDAESRLPYILRNRGEMQTFIFGPPPSAKLSIPVELDEMIKKGIEAQARLLAPIPRP